MTNISKQLSICAAALALASIAAPAQAAVSPSQVRVNIGPTSSDLVWKTTGIKFEKQIDCKIIKATATNPAFPLATDIISSGSAKAPLFNPGLAQPNGTYNTMIKTGDNTIYVPLDFAVDVKSYVGCSGKILANGVDVTAATRGGLTYATIMQIGGTGPIGVSPVLSTTRLQTVLASLPKTGTFELIVDARYSETGALTAAMKKTRLNFDFDSASYSPSSYVQFDIGIDDNRQMTTTVVIRSAGGGVSVDPGSGGPANLPNGGLDLARCKIATYGTHAPLYSGGNPAYRCVKTSSGKFAVLHFLGRYTEYVPNPGPALYGSIHTFKFDYVLWP